jgi:Flp pilus assembly protein TadD
MRSMRLLSGFLVVTVAAFPAAASDSSAPEPSAAFQDVVGRASALYQRTEYENSLHVLAGNPKPGAEAHLLSGKNYFMLADYKRATEFFEKARALSPNNSDYELWLGRAWGRRAETGGWLTAPFNASKARQCFERAVALDPHNREAKNDLFSFDLNAPGFLGGGVEKAEAIARSIATERPPESEFEQAQIADRRGDHRGAEAHLRRAMELAPTEAGRVVDLARYVAKLGRLDESDRLFEQARKLAPRKPTVAFAEARVDIENHRNLEQARGLLEGYLHADLTPDDPPRRDAEKLLRLAGG